MLGQGKDNQRMRLLIKILALSDIVIYRTKAERLHKDLFHFLGDASKSYNEHFSAELRRVSTHLGGVANGGRENSEERNVSLGPSVIIYPETLHTEVRFRVPFF